MTPALAFFYGGLVNESSIITTMMMSYGCCAIVTFLWGLYGYSIAFSPTVANGVIGGLTRAPVDFLQTEAYPYAPTITESTFMVYQLMFAIITCAIISGAVVGKIKWIWFMVFTALWLTFVYCPLAHYIFYGGGWLNTWGALDFAGGLVVHASSGISAFVLTYWLGSTHHVNRPHNVPFVLLGTALLWFGWFGAWGGGGVVGRPSGPHPSRHQRNSLLTHFTPTFSGFNAGSAVSANGLAGLAFVNTQFAAAFAMLTWNLLEIVFNGPPGTWFKGKATAVGACCGVLTGLVGITPACGFVAPMWAFFIGAFTVLVVFFAPRAVKRVFPCVDDKLDCFVFHGVGGITGALLTGLFATYTQSGISTITYGQANGAFYYNAPTFYKQIVAILVTIAFSVIGTSAIFWIITGLARLFRTDIRIPVEEGHSVDASQHGENAYGAAKVEAFASTRSVPSVARTLPDGTALEVAGSKQLETAPVVAEV